MSSGVGAALLVLVLLGSLPWLMPTRAHDAALAGERWLPLRPALRAAARAQDTVDDAVVLDLVRAALMTGADVVGAVEAVGEVLPRPQGEPYVRAARALRLGAGWDEAWRHQDAVARALEPSWADGVDPEPLLRHAAAAIRAERRSRAREAAARLGVRLVLPLGLCLLPAFVLLGLVPLLISAGLQLWGG